MTESKMDKLVIDHHMDQCDAALVDSIAADPGYFMRLSDKLAAAEAGELVAFEPLESAFCYSLAGFALLKAMAVAAERMDGGGL